MFAQAAASKRVPYIAAYAPKMDVRGVVFDDSGRLLMVWEIADQGRWTLPGGWADVNLTAAENVFKEVREESGFDVQIRKLAAIWDRTRQGYPSRPILLLQALLRLRHRGRCSGDRTRNLRGSHGLPKLNYRTISRLDVFCRTNSGGCSCTPGIPRCLPDSTKP
jgi:ADP-ribose pyrophosphatase YjhB (NUDIX family)